MKLSDAQKRDRNTFLVDCLASYVQDKKIRKEFVKKLQHHGMNAYAKVIGSENGLDRWKKLKAKIKKSHAERIEDRRRIGLRNDEGGREAQGRTVNGTPKEREKKKTNKKTHLPPTEARLIVDDEASMYNIQDGSDDDNLERAAFAVQGDSERNNDIMGRRKGNVKRQTLRLAMQDGARQKAMTRSQLARASRSEDMKWSCTLGTHTRMTQENTVEFWSPCIALPMWSKLAEFTR